MRAWEEFVRLFEVYGTNQPVNYTFQDNSHWRGLQPIVRREVIRSIFITMQKDILRPEPGYFLNKSWHIVLTYISAAIANMIRLQNHRWAVASSLETCFREYLNGKYYSIIKDKLFI